MDIILRVDINMRLYIFELGSLMSLCIVSGIEVFGLICLWPVECILGSFWYTTETLLCLNKCETCGGYIRWCLKY